MAWEDHTRREANAHSWPAELLRYRAKAWLQAKRMQHDSKSMQAGRTGTPVQAGKVQTRWHDGAPYARQFVQLDSACAGVASASRRRRELEQAIMRERATSVKLPFGAPRESGRSAIRLSLQALEKVAAKLACIQS